MDEFRLLIFPLVTRRASVQHARVLGTAHPNRATLAQEPTRFPRRHRCSPQPQLRHRGDHTTYYDPAAAALAAVAVDPAQDPYYQYKGPQAFSEPETQAVRDLVSNNKPLVFVDVHMWGRQIQYPWGMERDQSDDSDENFSEHRLRP